MRLPILLSIAVGFFAACSPQSAQTSATLTPEVIGTPSAPPAESIATAQPSPEPTSAGPVMLNIWWPEPLAPIDDQDAADLLAEQIGGFQSANDDVNVGFRLKKVQDVGGIMSTLRSASLVAPSAIPDLTLMRRSDLLAAAQAGLIFPIEDRASAAILDNLHLTTATLGRVNDRLYGLPYNVEVQHVAYQMDSYTLESWSFDTVLAEEAAYVFPAGRANTLSTVFLAQYRAATGTLDSGDIIVNAQALRTLFEFYERATVEGVIDPIVLEYIVPSDYRVGLSSGVIPAGVVTSSLYLQLLREGAELDFAPIPTESGAATTVIDGWMWVLTTADAEQQAAALRFLNWMMDINRQAQYNQAIAMLPSQRMALRQWDDEAYTLFVDSLLNNATLPLADTEGGVTARVMQSALASVISGQRSAQEAAQDVIAQLPS